MYTEDFIEQVRNLAQVPDTDEDITDEFILTQGYLGLLERFTQPIIMLRNGTWLHSYEITTTSGVSRYRIPDRSIVQGLEKLECAMGQGDGNAGSSQWYLLNVQTNIQATNYEGLTFRGRPAAFTYVGDTVEIFPTPTTNWNLRLWYYLRPSTLQTIAYSTASYLAFLESITAIGGGVYDLTLETTVLDSYGSLNVDLQFAAGNAEVAAVNVASTYPGISNHRYVTLTANEAAIIENGIENGGVVILPAAQATPIIPLPAELCNALVSYVGAVVLAEKGDSEKAQVFSQKAELAIKNIVDIAIPRSKGQPNVVKTRTTYLRRRIGRWGWGGGWGYW